MSETDEHVLRRLLWLRHGCPGHALYGDDGEFQCSACMIDFLRASPADIEARFIQISEPHVAEALRILAIKSPRPAAPDAERMTKGGPEKRT